MIDLLKQFKPELENDLENYNLKKKILCILEGKEELKYIYKIFQLNGYNSNCDNLDIDCIKLSWGKEQKIDKCDFKGGSWIKGCPVPKPVLESLNKENDNFWLYEYIIIMFDSDKDRNNFVQNSVLGKNLDNIILLVSNPCFESTLIDYCSCGSCRDYIDNLSKTKYPCSKYKNNFSKLNCFKGVGDLIVNLENYQTNNIKLNTINYYISKYSKKYKC